MLLWLPVIGATLDGQRRRQYDGPSGSDIDCKEVSLSAPSWYIYDPTYTRHDASSGGTLGEAGFDVYNLATNESFRCYAPDLDLSLTGDESLWHNCSVPDAQFTFDLTDNLIGLKETWTCDNAPTQVVPSFTIYLPPLLAEPTAIRRAAF